jgi:hypothetical protein
VAVEVDNAAPTPWPTVDSTRRTSRWRWTCRQHSHPNRDPRASPRDGARRGWHRRPRRRGQRGPAARRGCVHPRLRVAPARSPSLTPCGTVTAAPTARRHRDGAQRRRPSLSTTPHGQSRRLDEAGRPR